MPDAQVVSPSELPPDLLHALARAGATLPGLKVADLEDVCRCTHRSGAHPEGGSCIAKACTKFPPGCAKFDPQAHRFIPKRTWTVRKVPITVREPGAPESHTGMVT